MKGTVQRFIDFIFRILHHLKQDHFLTVQIQTSDIFVLSATKKTFKQLFVWKDQTEIALGTIHIRRLHFLGGGEGCPHCQRLPTRGGQGFQECRCLQFIFKSSAISILFFNHCCALNAYFFLFIALNTMYLIFII